jgi:hypothetical protein
VIDHLNNLLDAINLQRRYLRPRDWCWVAVS